MGRGPPDRRATPDRRRGLRRRVRAPVLEWALARAWARAPPVAPLERRPITAREVSRPVPVLQGRPSRAGTPPVPVVEQRPAPGRAQAVTEVLVREQARVGGPTARAMPRLETAVVVRGPAAAGGGPERPRARPEAAVLVRGRAAVKGRTARQRTTALRTVGPTGLVPEGWMILSIPRASNPPMSQLLRWRQ